MSKVQKLSIVIPCYNEEATIQTIVYEVLSVDIGTTKKEIIIVDDCSNDNTRTIIGELVKHHPTTVRAIFQDHNQGKGAALRCGILESTGDAVIIQDADLEYDPEDYKRLLRPLEREQADVVYGSRFMGGEARRMVYGSNVLANRVLTKLSNLCSGLKLTDMETCYKVIRGDLARSMAKDLKAQRFGFEPEITARIAKSKASICEVSISYYGRSKAEGKKIGYRDGLRAIWEIIYFNLTVKSSVPKELHNIHRIAVVSDTIYPYFKGGKERRIFEITTRLAKMGYDVHIYSMKWWEGPKDIEDNGVHFHGISKLYKVYRSEGRRSIVAGVLFGISCLKLFTVRFDIVDVDHMPYMPLFSVWLVCKLRRKKMYATWHEVWSRQYWNQYLGFFGIIAYFIERLGTLLPDRIIVDSAFTQRRLVDRNPRRRGQLMSAYNGADLSAIEAARPSKKKSDIIYAGRLLSHKNVGTLLKAIKELKVHFPDVRCVIVGDGPEKGRLIKQAHKLGIDENVDFTGFLPEHHQVFSRMKSSKIFVLPSEREGFGMVVVEANACGLPVLTYDHPDNAATELITEAVNGYTFKTYKELANTMRMVLLNYVDAHHYTDSAKQYDWQTTVNSVVEAYSE